MAESLSLPTQAIHAGSIRPRVEGAIVTPIFQSSTFEYHGEGYHDIGYIRLSTTPNHRVLTQRIAALEGTEAAICTGSGMAAISTALLSLLNAGDHILVQDCVYGGTSSFLRTELPRFGITHSEIDSQEPESWARALTPHTRLIYVEALSNPLIQVADLQAVAEFSQDHGLISVVDNTFASPVNFTPVTLGFDIVIESATKYLAGHSDLTAGCVAGSAQHISRVKRTLDHLGGILDPHTCFLLERGIKTLPLRVAHQNETALRTATFLNEHRAVVRVHYPGLPTHAQHNRAARLFRGFGGILAFELGGAVEDAEQFLAQLSIPAVAPSLGGVESLVVRPAATTHATLAPEERLRAGITETLIRLSVGLESSDDLIEDIDRALGSM